MPTFVFTLESVLTQRRSAERERQLALAAIVRERLAIEDNIRRARTRADEAREELRAQLHGEAGGVNLHGARMQSATVLRCLARAQQDVRQLAAVHQRQEIARRALAEAATRRKAIERLRERRVQAWQEDQKRRELGALDELAVMSAARNDSRGDA